MHDGRGRPLSAREDVLRLAESKAIDRVTELRAALDDAQSDLRIKRSELASCLRERAPRPDELVYAHDRCDCGSRMAYWRAAEPQGWDCASVLLGHSSAADVALHSDQIPFHHKLRIDHGRRSA
jgi:hypothetical protein